MNYKINTSDCIFTKAVLRVFSPLALFALIAVPNALQAQTGGEGAITGTVTDPSGAVVAGASVTATNIATGVITTRPTTSDGLY
jgi:hypothetical protein